MSKYSKELREEMKAKAAQGMIAGEIGREYGIHEKTIVNILDEHSDEEKRKVSKSIFADLHGRRESTESMDGKELDSRQCNIWCHKFRKHLEETRLYGGMPVIHVDKQYFTYRHKNGYNKTVDYIELYNKQRG